MRLFVRVPHGEAAEFVHAAEVRLNGHVGTLTAVLDSPLGSLDALPDALLEVLTSPELPALARDADVDILVDLRDEVMAGGWKLTSAHLRRASPNEVWERLRWMLTQPVVFYPKSQVSRSDQDVTRLAGAFARWWLGGSSDWKVPIPSSWRYVAIDPDGIEGFGNGFYDTAFLAYRGYELRLLLQDGSD